jgi:uncharacterized repeat protein (TIGR03837 family)
MMHFYTIMRFTAIDVFCHVVDNFGDIGVVYRFAKEFKYANPNCRVRVFVDDLEALRFILPDIDPRAFVQRHVGIEYIGTQKLNESAVRELGTAQVLVEAFACHIPEAVLNAASAHKTYIINLDHLSAEKWVEGYHLKESLLGRGGLRKYFFMPGFTIDTGGVIIDTDIENARVRLEENRLACLNGYLQPFDIILDNATDSLFGAIFIYEYRFDTLLEAMMSIAKPVYLFVFNRKSIQSMMLTIDQKKVGQRGDFLYRIGNIHIICMPFLAQHKYDELLCLVDFNFVRGEDTWVRAILAEKPFLWHAYKQDGNYQLVKAKAFLDAFRVYWEDEETYCHFCELFMRFNDSSIGAVTEKQYDHFFRDMNKIGHATKKMSYFIKNKCNLVKKFNEFLFQLG